MLSRCLIPCLLPTAASFPAAAQVVQGDKPTEGQIAAGEAPVTPLPEGEIALRGLPANIAAPRWTKEAARDLLAFADGVGAEGLDASDYRPDRLREMLEGDDERALDLVATDMFLRLSADLALGHVRSDAASTGTPAIRTSMPTASSR